MLKKTILATLAATIFGSTSWAGDMGPISAQKTINEFQAGPYLGVSIGPRISLTGNPLTYVGATGTLAAGYGHLWQQRYYLAGEIYGANSDNLKTRGKFTQGSTQYSLHPTWDYGIDAIPGLLLNPTTLGYARVGYEQTRMMLDSAYSSTGVNANAWRVGLGLQTNVYKSLDVRVEYIFTRYEQLSNFSAAGTPYATQGNIGLVYKFV